MVSLTAVQLCPCRVTECKSSPTQYVDDRCGSVPIKMHKTWQWAGLGLWAIVCQPLVSKIRGMNVALFFLIGLQGGRLNVMKAL